MRKEGKFWDNEGCLILKGDNTREVFGLYPSALTKKLADKSIISINIPRRRDEGGMVRVWKR